jgi:hypothetical protein
MTRATKLIANTPLNQRGWAKVFPEQAHKMVTIINGFDPERFTPSAAPGPIAKPLTILHAGELYVGRDPRPFLDVLQTERPPLSVEFLGRKTAGAFDLPTEIAARGLGDCVAQVDQVPYHEALHRMMRAGILLLIHTPGRVLGVPAKLYEYLGTGRPILALAEPAGDIAWVLRESKVLHRIAAPTDVPAIKQALLELTRAVQAGESVVPNPDALAQFTRENMARRFAACLEECVAAREKTVAS